jgi:hypothetical protein
MALGAVFLIAQLVWVLDQQAGSSRYFAWAPNDSETEYSIAVRVDDRALTPDEIQERYHIPVNGVDETFPGHVLSVVEQYEATYGRDDGAIVTVSYRVNGHQPSVLRIGT